MTYTITATHGMAKAATLATIHGEVHTPVFMNVATAAAIKGALSAEDLRVAGCQIALANTYHLHLRPGEEVVRAMGGLGKFMDWHGPTLTDSGGFQVFSLAAMRKIREEGVYFNSHIDGRKIFMGAEESMEIQAALGATIAMAFDECPPSTAPRAYIEESVARTTRWLARSAAHNEKVAPHQLLFGIAQGGMFEDIRAAHAREIAAFGLPGYAIGGLAVGETHTEMYRMLDVTVPHLPRDKPTYLMGVGTPLNILEAVARGVDFFDCVLPARNGRHGHLFTSHGALNMKNAAHEMSDIPIDDNCDCPACTRHSRAYLRHLFKAGEMLAMRLAVQHNLHFYNKLMRDIRAAIIDGTFTTMKNEMEEKLS